MRKTKMGRSRIFINAADKGVTGIETGLAMTDRLKNFSGWFYICDKTISSWAN